MLLAQRTRIKVCGITNRRDALAAIELGVDALGFIFIPASRRYIKLADALNIARALPPMVSLVGVFADADEQAIASVVEKMPLSVLQFHGAETAADCVKWHQPYIKAVKVKDDVSIAAVVCEHEAASALLLDTFVAGQDGGTGKTFDWSLIPAIDRPFVLAGGLTPANVAAAIKQVEPYAVDVCSGVETEPGIKSEQLLQSFVTAVRS